MTKWFVEERQPTGHYAPVIYHGEKPTEKRTESRRKFRAEPMEIDASYHNLTLKQAAEIYGAKQMFRSQRRKSA